MISGDLSTSGINRNYDRHQTIPKIKLPTMIRLGFFQMGLGMMSVMVFGVLNRVLIKELAVPSTIATMILALTLFVDEDDRSRLVAVDWSMLISGTIIGAITIGALLKLLEINATIAEVQAQINRLFFIIPAIVLLLTFVATWGVEKKYSRFSSRVGTQKQRAGSHLSLGRAVAILTASRQTQVFLPF